MRRRKKPGQRRYGKDPLVKVSVMLPPSLARDLDREARRRVCSVSQVAREWLARGGPSRAAEG